MIEISGYSLFCEDIREEIGGRFTLVGVMRPAIGISEFPTTLAKLGIMSKVMRDPESREPLTVRVVYHLPSGEIRILAEETSPSHQGPVPPPIFPALSGLNAQVLETHIVFSPLKLEAPGRIEVIAETSGQETLIDALSFAVIPTDHPANTI